MTLSPSTGDELDEATRGFYRRTLRILLEAGVPFLVGGAYAFQRYTDIARDTKDFDVFVRHSDAGAALEALRKGGYDTDLTFPHWLGKAFHADASVDIIFGSGNGIVPVDDEWFSRAVADTVLDIEVGLCPPEEMIRSKAFIMERERFDGADILHLIRARAGTMDWRFLLERFGDHWRVLLAHVILFGFVYAGERTLIPGWVTAELTQRLAAEGDLAEERTCRGTLLSRQQYLIDIGSWGYKDARLVPEGTMSREDIAHWTAAIGT